MMLETENSKHHNLYTAATRISGELGVVSSEVRLSGDSLSSRQQLGRNSGAVTVAWSRKETKGRWMKIVGRKTQQQLLLFPSSGDDNEQERYSAGVVVFPPATTSQAENGVGGLFVSSAAGSREREQRIEWLLRGRHFSSGIWTTQQGIAVRRFSVAGGIT